jgi:hypothetical protein
MTFREAIMLLTLFLAVSLYQIVSSMATYRQRMLSFLHDVGTPTMAGGNELGIASDLSLKHPSIPVRNATNDDKNGTEIGLTSSLTLLNVSNNTLLAPEQQFDQCFQLNSERWLKGIKISNTEMQDDWIDTMMMTPYQLLQKQTMSTVLEKTMCYESGRFRSVATIWNSSDEQQIDDWRFRLLYLAIHHLHHAPAYGEYQLRQNCGMPGNSDQLPYTIQKFDYECPTAKFLVTVLSTMGMGATFRSGAFPAMLMALSTGRIPLFLQSINADGLPKFLTTNFQLASCKRRDLQCVFLPTSPCAVTLDDLQNATYLSEGEARNLKRSGRLKNPDHENSRVLVHLTNMVPLNAKHAIHKHFRKVAHDTIWNMLYEWRNTTVRKELITSEQWNVLTSAADWFRQSVTSDPDDVYWNQRAVQFYFMRPNMVAQDMITRQANSILPPDHKKRKMQFFGLPIRGKFATTVFFVHFSYSNTSMPRKKLTVLILILNFYYTYKRFG